MTGYLATYDADDTCNNKKKQINILCKICFKKKKKPYILCITSKMYYEIGFKNIIQCRECFIMDLDSIVNTQSSNIGY